MPSMDTERLESFHLAPVSTQEVGSNVEKKKPGKGGQKQMLLKGHDFQDGEGKCLRCTYPLTSRHERNTTGERDSWVPQGSSEPQEPHTVSNCYENPGSRSEANYLHGKLSLF